MDGGGGGGEGRRRGDGEGEVRTFLPPSSPPNSGGQFLLQLLQKSQTPTPPPLSHNINNNISDPAVAALGPTVLPFPSWPSNGQDPHPHPPHPPWSTTPSPNPPPYQTPPGSSQSPPNFHVPGFPSNPPWPSHPGFQTPTHPILPHEIYQLGRLGLLGSAGSPPLQLEPQHLQQQQKQKHQLHQHPQQQQQESMLMFGSLACDLRNQEALPSSSKPHSQGEFASQVDRGFGRSNGSSNGSVMGSKFIPNWEFSDLPHRMNSDRTQLENQRLNHQQGRREDVNGEGWGRKQDNFEFQRTPLSETRSVPPGFSQKTNGVGHSRGMPEPDHNMGKKLGSQRESDQQAYQRRQSAENHRIQSDLSMRLGLVGQNDRRGSTQGDKMYPIPAMGIEESLMKLQREAVEGGNVGFARQEKKSIDNKGGQSHRRGVDREREDLAEQLMGSMVLRDGFDSKNGMTQQFNNSQDKEFKRLWTPPQRMRNYRREIECRSDIDRLDAPFLAVYESLVPPAEEKAKQKQLLASLEKLVNKEWPSAQLYLYGSCANSFGVSKSDIDVCLRIEDADISKSEILLKLADILQSDKLENVQALTRARVPIVKLMDPITGISCDICINNVLAVVNTKLLRDYAQIDGRLRELVFIVKHWAKSRGVNETYRGTLSSYAYVLMCIHFLQQRKPAILPCLQGMETTYAVTVDDIDCAFFDKVDNLCEFGAQNKETIAELVWGFFDYWAYRHDYANSVISIRTGSIISKRAKDWTRRIGNDRHLICIEDPFQVSHDLGRVVDKFSIKVLREEFERAANIMQYDPDPHVTLFEPYVPSK